MPIVTQLWCPSRDIVCKPLQGMNVYANSTLFLFIQNIWKKKNANKFPYFEKKTKQKKFIAHISRVI